MCLIASFAFAGIGFWYCMRLYIPGILFCSPNKPVKIQLGDEIMIPPDSCLEKDMRKTIIRGGYLLIFDIRRGQDFVEPRM